MLCLLLILGVACAQIEETGNHDFSIIREGDVVFRRGGGVASRAVLLADAGGMYSHVGVVVDGGRVVHSVPEGGVKIEALEAFFAPRAAHRGAVMRLDSVVTVKVAHFVGAEFDHDYDLADSMRLYCTELVWRAFHNAGVDLSEGRRSEIAVPGFDGEYILPSDLAKCGRLTAVMEF